MGSELWLIGGQGEDRSGNYLDVGGKGEGRFKADSQASTMGLVWVYKFQRHHNVDSKETRKENELSWTV